MESLISIRFIPLLSLLVQAFFSLFCSTSLPRFVRMVLTLGQFRLCTICVLFFRSVLHFMTYRFFFPSAVAFRVLNMLSNVLKACSEFFSTYLFCSIFLFFPDLNSIFLRCALQYFVTCFHHCYDLFVYMSWISLIRRVSERQRHNWVRVSYALRWNEAPSNQKKYTPRWINR